MNRWLVFALGMLTGAALFAAGTMLVPIHPQVEGGKTRPISARIVLI